MNEKNVNRQWGLKKLIGLGLILGVSIGTGINGYATNNDFKITNMPNFDGKTFVCSSDEANPDTDIGPKACGLLKKMANFKSKNKNAKILDPMTVVYGKNYRDREFLEERNKTMSAFQVNVLGIAPAKGTGTISKIIEKVKDESITGIDNVRGKFLNGDDVDQLGKINNIRDLLSGGKLKTISEDSLLAANADLDGNNESQKGITTGMEEGIKIDGTIYCGGLSDGDTFDIEGITYTVYDNTSIKSGLSEAQFETACTSNITDISELLKSEKDEGGSSGGWWGGGSEIVHHNPDISHWDTSNVIDMSGMFQNNTEFNQDISKWDTSNVITMERMFYEAEIFNQDISGWDTTNVQNMSYMFAGFFDSSTFFGGLPTIRTQFNQDISGWNTTNVQNMSYMFYLNDDFNQDISEWDVSNVENMKGMFQSTTSFNQDISDWDTSNVITMERMFSAAKEFNQSLNAWDTSNVTNMANMFSLAYTFNSDISSWDTSSVTNMSYMFKGPSSRDKITFNQDISGWDTSNVIDMSYMFEYNTTFDSNISSWDVSNVTNMENMFAYAENFNQNIGDWNTTSVTNMALLFRSAYSFNQDIGDWDVSNVTNMLRMFRQANNFDQDISDWDVFNVSNMTELFAYSESFNQDLSSWCPDVIERPFIFTDEEKNPIFHLNTSFHPKGGNWSDTSCRDNYGVPPLGT